jgi:hypothetical protein
LPPLDAPLTFAGGDETARLDAPLTFAGGSEPGRG